MSRTQSIINRLPHFYQSEETNNNLYQWVSVFAKALNEAEEDLIRVMRSHWVNTANNEGSKGLDSSTKGDLDKILALFLENLGGTSLLRQTNRRSGEQGIEDDLVYRERMKGLIQVILAGPSTKSGLIQIVSANLGILGNDTAANLAREQIRIVEFLPETRHAVHNSVQLVRPIEVHNPNPDATTAEIIVSVLDLDFPLERPRIVHAGTGAYWQYPGTVVKNSEIIFFRNGTGLYRGQPFIAEIGNMGLTLQPGNNQLFLDSDIGTVTGTFDSTLFDYALFDQGRVFPTGKFDQSLFDTAVFVPDLAVANVEINIDKLYPGSFSVVVPWDSPGFTVKFRIKPSFIDRLVESAEVQPEVLAELLKLNDIELDTMTQVGQVIDSLDASLGKVVWKILLEEIEPTADLFATMAVNPRSQIKYIVNKVKAAGVLAVVAYEKRFVDTHELQDGLQLSGELKRLEEDQNMLEHNFDMASIQQPYPGGLQHQLDDNLLLSGVFDFSGFDSMNGFA